MGKAKKIRQPMNKGVAKVPVVIQMEALECGAASFAMVLAYYGKWIPLEQVRADCGVSRDGSNARNVLRAARSYGLVAKGYRYEVEELKENGQFPCIIHWNFNHFPVLCGFKGGKAVLNDPAQGHYSVPMEVFDKAFTGICLTFEPGENFEPGGKPKSVMAFARQRMKGTSEAVAFTVITAVIASLLGIIQLGFSGVFLDRLLTGENPEWITPFIWGLAALSLVQILIALIQGMYSARINGKIAAVGSTTFMWKILQMPMVFFSQRMAGDIQQRKGTNSLIAGSLVSIFAPLFIQVCMMIFYLAVMLRYRVMLTLVGIGAVVVNTAMSHIISAKRVNITRVQMRDSGKLSGTTVAGIEMIETIKASGAENGFLKNGPATRPAYACRKPALPGLINISA